MASNPTSTREAIGERMPDLRSHMAEFQTKWGERLGGVGEDLARDLAQLVDLLFMEQERIIDETVRERVASWALAGSDEKIPLNKISKEGLMILLANPDYISNGELMEMLKARFPDF